MVSSPISNVPLKRRQSSHNKPPSVSLAFVTASVTVQYPSTCANYSTVNTPLLTYLLTSTTNRHRQSKFTLLLSLNYINETIVERTQRRLPFELHYSGLSRRGLFSKAIGLGLYTCTICMYIHTHPYIYIY